jgi:hypothetical protein
LQSVHQELQWFSFCAKSIQHPKEGAGNKGAPIQENFVVRVTLDNNEVYLAELGKFQKRKEHDHVPSVMPAMLKVLETLSYRPGDGKNLDIFVFESAVVELVSDVRAISDAPKLKIPDSVLRCYKLESHSMEAEKPVKEKSPERGEVAITGQRGPPKWENSMHALHDKVDSMHRDLLFLKNAVTRLLQVENMSESASGYRPVKRKLSGERLGQREAEEALDHFMPDEDAAVFNQLHVHNLQDTFIREKVRGDGNCGPTALSIYVGTDAHLLRFQVHRWAEANPEFKALVDSFPDERELAAAHVIERLGTDRAWVGMEFFRAASELLGRAIVVVSPEHVQVFETPGEGRDVFARSSTIFIAFNGRNHFDCLIRK